MEKEKIEREHQLLNGDKTLKQIFFSRSTRLQLLTIDLIAHTMNQMIHGKSIKSKTIKVCKRILRRTYEIRLVLGNGIIPLPLSNADIKTYHKFLLKLTNYLKPRFEQKITIDLLNAIMFLSEEALEGSLKTNKSKLQQHWRQINKSLLTLYTHIDPEFNETDYMPIGTKLGTELKQIISG